MTPYGAIPRRERQQSPRIRIAPLAVSLKAFRTIHRSSTTDANSMRKVLARHALRSQNGRSQLG